MINLFSSISFILFSIFTFENGKLEVTSQAFNNGSPIPVIYTCEGDDTNPGLVIRAVPSNAKTLAIIMDDPDAPGGFNHWLAWNIASADSNVIAENSIIGTEGKNSAGKNGYKGPCPPSGKHTYYFRVYALDVKLNIRAGSDRKTLEKAMRGHIVASGKLTGTYFKKNNILEKE